MPARWPRGRHYARAPRPAAPTASLLVQFRDTGLPLNRDGMAFHLQQLRDAGMSSAPAAVAALRKLAQHAAERGLLTAEEFNELKAVTPGPVSRSRPRTALTVTEVVRLLAF